MKKLIIIGGGAAGMLSAVIAAERGFDVHLYEKNEKLGKKLFITGKGRCNLTNACDVADIFNNITRNSKFMYSSVYGFDNNAVIEFFERLGLRVKVERGNRVFPVSDHSSDVIRVLTDRMKQFGVKLHLCTEVRRLLIEKDCYRGIILSDGSKEQSDACFVATGGLSYPVTGSTGDGYRFAKETGHEVTELVPSLVSIHTSDSFIKKLEGLSLKNVILTAAYQGKSIFSELGEMLFTANGISGPLVLSASSYIAEKKGKGKNDINLSIDLKPALTEEQLDARLLRDFSANANKQYKNALDDLLPKKLISVIIELSGINPDKRVNLITKEERTGLVRLLKGIRLSYKGLGGYNEAVITKGGIVLKDINPSTMESKHVKGLHFIGEVLDVDALTGGFNLQIAWSTAYAAAASLKNQEEC